MDWITINFMIWFNILMVIESVKEVKCLLNDKKGKEEEFQSFCEEVYEEVPEKVYDEGFIEDINDFDKRIEEIKSKGGEEYGR